LAVLEVSSFMAERLRRARFDWGVLLNLYPNHLDRYNSLQDYYRAKWGLLERSATKFFPKDVENVLSLHSDLEFSQEESSLFLLQHVAQRVDPQLVEIDLKRLPSLAHRQEFWMASDGRAYVNDSKSTTVQSTLAALRQFQPRFERIHLILGGKDKGDDFSRLLKILRSSDSVWIYGVSAEKIQNDLKSFSGTIEKRERFSDLMAACRQALKMGELLLLSPGATSWDQFANFEERGRQFWKLVGRPAY
jgi:UDP-N-acetylmuramoylalanine--D-glutamate ligase